HSQSCSAGERVPGESATKTSWSRCVHDFGASGDSSERQSSAHGFGRDDKIRLDAVTLAGEESTRASEAGLNFVRNEQDAMLLAKLGQHLEVARRWCDESAFSKHRLSNHRGNLLVRHHTFECVFEVTCTVQVARRVLQVVGAAIAVGKRNAVDLAGERRESGLIRM